MQEIKGIYNTAKIFTDIPLEDNVISQIQTLCNQYYTKESKIRIMPDVHAGAGCTIGTTMTITDKIVPNLVGVDIGCGMETVQLKQKHIELQKLDKLIYEKIPSGFSIHKTPHAFADEIDLSQLRCAKFVNIQRAYCSIGTLGGGNHFIEVNQNDIGTLYIVVHSGSRHIGLEVANYYQKAGYEKLNKNDKNSINELIAQYHAQHRQKEIQSALKALKQQVLTNFPYALACVEGNLFEDYIHDMKLIQQFAVLNRKAILHTILKGMNLKVEETFTTIHNYIDTDTMILRKGAVSAKKGEKLLIPINMRDGSLICEGKGNPDWNESAPHGAGRIMSRTQAKKAFTVSEFKKQMKGVYTSSVNKNTLDECPMAYKTMEDIVRNITPTAEIKEIIKPIYNFKAGEEDT